MQPAAPFGEYAGFTLGEEEPAPPTIPASARLGSAELAREVASVTAARQALHALVEGRPDEARERFDALLAETPPVLDPARLAIGAAQARFALGDFAGAGSALAPAVAEDAPVDVRISALALRALCADRLGRRAEAVELHRAVLALVEAHPEWNHFESIAALAREGLERSLAEREPVHSLYVLRIPF
jgi:tetratricopeptide (TPR) repeat protein